MGLGHRRSDMLKSYFVEHILLTFLKYVFFKNGIYVVKSKFFISQINIMHKYTETESKYTSKVGTHSMWEQIYIIL